MRPSLKLIVEVYDFILAFFHRNHLSVRSGKYRRIYRTVFQYTGIHYISVRITFSCVVGSACLQIVKCYLSGHCVYDLDLFELSCRLRACLVIEETYVEAQVLSEQLKSVVSYLLLDRGACVLRRFQLIFYDDHTVYYRCSRSHCAVLCNGKCDVCCYLVAFRRF